MMAHVSSLAVIRIGVDPALHAGPLSIHWYGVMYAVAFVAGFRFGVLPHLLPRGVSRHDCDRMLVWVIIAGLLGARLYYDIQQPLGPYLRDPVRIIAVWEGGMDFFGAIFAGVAMIAFLCWRERRNFWLMFDAAVLFAVVGQPIGRIGNIINGDILGAPSAAPWATAYTNTHAILQAGYQLGVAYQPAGAYEALCAIAIGIVLVLLRRRGVRDGVLALTYFSLYAISQFLIFYVRESEPVVGLGLKQSQWTCLAMLVVGMPVLFTLWRRTRGDGTQHRVSSAEAAH
jgi:phosphatidylglycerol:prolipoprotein diacylglycerol transferase